MENAGSRFQRGSMTVEQLVSALVTVAGPQAVAANIDLSMVCGGAQPLLVRGRSGHTVVHAKISF